MARALKPRMLIRSMVHHQFDQHLDIPPVSFRQKLAEVIQRSVARMHARVIGNVVSIIEQRRGKEWKQP